MNGSQVYTIFSDGGSRGNPGPAAYGFVIYNTDGTVVCEGSEYIGVTTNNQAEYQGIVAALNAAQSLEGVENLVCKLDSQLVVRQINGVYRMKSEELKPWLHKVHELVAAVKVPVKFIDVPRAQNAYADRLVNQALDGLEKDFHG